MRGWIWLGTKWLGVRARHSKVRVVWQTPTQQTLNTGDSTQAVTTEEVSSFDVTARGYVCSSKTTSMSSSTQLLLLK